MKEGHGGIWVYAGHSGGRIDRSAMELLGKARKLADKIGTELSAILVGFGVKSFAHEPISYGANLVYTVDDERLTNYTTMPYTRLLVDLIRVEKPGIVLFSADANGRDLAPRIAARLETGLTADCVDLDIGDFEDKESGNKYQNVLLQVVPAFGGNVMATIVNPERRPQMATVRPGTFDVPDKDLNRRGDVLPCEVELKEGDNAVEVLEIISKENHVSFDDARIVVAGGRGAGGIMGFNLLRDLANVIGAEVGASRAAIDAGWISPDHMVGIGGQTVRPDIYIACGISGAMHHVMGVKNSKIIIAINKDPNAPIFDVADYIIIGDLFEVVPKLIGNIKGKRAITHGKSVVNPNRFNINS